MYVMIIKQWTIYKAMLAFLVLALFSCAPKKINQSTFSNLYKKGQHDFNDKFIIYHLNDSVSKLFFDFSNERFLYKKADTNAHYYSNIKVFLKIKSVDDLNLVKDTSSLIIYDKQDHNLSKQLTGSLLFKLKKGTSYYIDIDIRDINKKVNYTSTVFSDKTTRFLRQNFLISNNNGDIFFSSHYKPNEKVVVHTNLNKDTSYQIDCFNSNFNLASPPFSSEPMPHFSYKPDSSYLLSTNNQKLEILLSKKGFYHLKTNHTTKDGVTFFVFDSVFPKLKNTEKMILATRYVMAKKEFDGCMAANNKKECIDKFWLDIGGNTDKAKELIKKYYGRVQEANILFTSFKEGWKTDRGMIYIIFGPPNKVSKTKNEEIWTYGEIDNSNSIIFYFVKVINPFTDADYYLQRNETLKEPWYQAVDSWRQGKIYLGK